MDGKALPTALIVVLSLVLLAPSLSAQSVRLDLAQDGIGIPPHDFEFWQTGGGPQGQWAVVRDVTTASGVALEQFSVDKTEGRLPLAIYRSNSIKNVEVTARFKLLEGSTLTAGIAIRLTSADSYYAVVANALEGRIDLFRFAKAQRKRIAGVDANVLRSHWQTLKVAAIANSFAISLDGNWLFTAFDNGFAKDGHVALWTEEDNVTRFNEIAIKPLALGE